MTDRHVYIIAEAGVNHNGRLDLALKLCDAAKAAGADAVKFQTWKTELIITRDTEMAGYQKENLGMEESQFDMLKKLELSFEDFRTVKDYCDRIGIQFLSTADEPQAQDFLCSLGIPCIKLGSGDIDNIPFLRYCAGKGLPVILSTGMSRMEDVRKAYDTLRKAGAGDVTVLHCTTNYPCPMEEVNLNAMLSIRDELGCKVGYSDHTMGIEVPVAAVALGAEVIEKHFTLSRAMEGPDHRASLEPDELSAMVKAIRNIESAMGDGVKRPTKSEMETSKVVLKTILAGCPIKKGEILSADKLAVKRAASGISVALWDTVVDTAAVRDFDTDEPISL